MIITFLILAIFLVLVYFSHKQENAIHLSTQILWTAFLLIPPLLLTIGSFIKIEQIKNFEENFLLQHATITGHHKEDSDMGKQPFAMIYWVYFKINGDCFFKQQVSLATYNQLKPGDQIIVQVSSQNPRLCRAEIE